MKKTSAIVENPRHRIDARQRRRPSHALMLMMRFGKLSALSAVFALVVQGHAGAQHGGDDPIFLYRMGHYEQAVDVWLAEAKAGDVEAQYQAGHALTVGAPVVRQPPEGIKWLVQAAQGSHPRAAYELAMINDRRGGDRSKMIEWTKIAADGGIPEAQYNLATLYEDGKLVPQSLTEALKWYAIAAMTFRPGERTEDLMSLIDQEVNLQRVSTQLPADEIRRAWAAVTEFMRSRDR